KKYFVDGIRLDGRGEFLHHAQYLAGEHLVPAEVALDEDAVGALAQRLPDGLARGDPFGFQLVALGDDAGALIAQHADGLLTQEGVADAFRRYVEAIGV